jgi:hypothetical protein
MVLEVSPQFQAIKRGPRRQVRWRLLLAHGRIRAAFMHMKLNGNPNLLEFFAYFPTDELGALRSTR